MAREELYLWWTGEADSIFVYYLTAAMTLAFLMTVAITKSLSRKEPRVTELFHEENLKDMLVTYILSITTSLTKGSSCCDNVKVFMQLYGEDGQCSQFFQLRTHKGGKPMFKRGLTDMFLLKVPVSLGKIKRVKLILSGADKSLSWKVTRIQLYEPDTGRLCDLPASVQATEMIGYGDATEKVIMLTRPCVQWFLNLCIYHQWLAGFVNTVRFGSFTEIVHVVLIFITLFNLLTFTLIAYILLPGSSLEDTFELNITSLLIGSSASSIVCNILCFGFELLIRLAKAGEKQPGNAYHTVVEDNICAKDIVHPKRTISSEERSNIRTVFVMSPGDFENDSMSLMFCRSSVAGLPCEIPAYLGKLMAFLALHEHWLKQLERQRLVLFERGVNMLSLTKSDQQSKASFMTCIQSLNRLPRCEINLPRFSEICLDRMLAGEGIEVQDDESIIKHKTKSYFEVLVEKLTSSSGDRSTYEAEIMTVDFSGKELGKFNYLPKESCVAIDIGNSEGKKGIQGRKRKATEQVDKVRSKFAIEIAQETSKKHKVSSLTKDSSVSINIDNSEGEIFKGIQGRKRKATGHTDKVRLADAERRAIMNVPGVAVNIEGDTCKEHIVNIEDIQMEETRRKETYKDIKIEETRRKQTYEDIKMEETRRKETYENIKMEETRRKETYENIKMEETRRKETYENIKMEETRRKETYENIKMEETGRKETYEAWCGVPDITVELVDRSEETLRRRRSMATKVMLECFGDKNDDQEHKQQDKVCSSDSVDVPDLIKYSTSSLPTSITRIVWREWQRTQRVWCRKLVQAVHESFKSCRSDLINGVLVISDIDIVILEWAHEAVKRLTAACSLRRVMFEEEMLQSQHLMQLFSHLSAEIIMLVISDVYTCLKSRDYVTLADLILQSHHVMLALEHATDSVAYLINKGSEEMCRLFRYLDMGQDLMDIRDRFIQMCFQLTVNYTDVTWAFFLALLRDEEDRTRHVLTTTLDRLTEYVESQLSRENEEDVVIKKMCRCAEKEAKYEVWRDYNNQECMFTCLLLKQRIVKQLSSMINEGRKRKRKFEEKHELLPEQIKTRLEKLVEKRRKVEENVLKKKRKIDKDSLQHCEAEKRELRFLSEAMGRYAETLAYVRDKVCKKWKREGLTGEVSWGLYLAQALLHPDVQTDEKHGLYSFQTFLHLKRTEGCLQTYLETLALEIADMLLNDIVEKHNIKFADPDDREKDFVVVDCLVMIDRVSIALLREVHSFTRQVIGTEQTLSSVDMAMVKHSSRLLMKRSLLVMDVNYSAAPPATERGKTAFFVGTASDEKIDDSSDDNDTQRGTPVYGDGDSVIQSLINELKPLRAYLKFMQKSESLRHQYTQKGYLNRQREKREYHLSVCINNIIDSYYLIQEGDDSHTFTKAGLYQLEHDVVGESSRPLPRWLKTVLLGVMLVMILFSMVYVTLTAAQFSTTEIQEWVCFYLFSVGLFGFVFEPVRAVILGKIVGNT